MKYYIDTEFNEQDGRLISIAIIPEQGMLSFYAVVSPLLRKPTPWVEENVMPWIRYSITQPISIDEIAKRLGDLFNGSNEESIEFIADHPADFMYLNQVLSHYAAMYTHTLPFVYTTRLVHVEGVTEKSKKPHHALYDAVALREIVQGEFSSILGEATN